MTNGRLFPKGPNLLQHIVARSDYSNCKAKGKPVCIESIHAGAGDGDPRPGSFGGTGLGGVSGSGVPAGAPINGPG